MHSQEDCGNGKAKEDSRVKERQGMTENREISINRYMERRSIRNMKVRGGQNRQEEENGKQNDNVLSTDEKFCRVAQFWANTKCDAFTAYVNLTDSSFVYVTM